MTNTLYEIMRLISGTMYSLFMALDNAKIDDYSLLDIALALIFLKVIIWFVKRFLGIESSNLGEVAAAHGGVYLDKARIGVHRTANRFRSWETRVARMKSVKKKRR